MRLLATVPVIVALATAVSPHAARQQGVPPAPAGSRRIPADPSDLMTHSPLVACNAEAAPFAGAPKPLRVATWNIRAARSASVAGIAGELRTIQADVIALQEVDVRMRRTGFVDEPADLATALGFHYVFAATIKWDEGDYGLAVLSRWPLTRVQRHRLDATASAEHRIVLEATICAGGRPLRVFNHHADGRAAARQTGLAELKRLVQADVGHGMLVMGDFNEHSDALGMRGLIDAGLVDLGAALNTSTSYSRRIDYLLADGPLARLSANARVWPTDKSDHHAVLADFEW